MFHLSVKPISRAAGRSATAAAAYRAGAEIVDHRTGEVHDYTRKSDIVHSEILVPPGAAAWAEDRTALWNAAEAAEKRKDARVARDYEVAIPKELTREQGIELARDFSQGLVDRYGVAVDFNVHRDELKNWDGSEKGYQAYHAHVLTSTRKLGREGFGDKAAIELSDAKRKSLGLGDGAAEIEHIRQLWEVAANRHLEQADQAQRIDRRSLKDQGIDRDPTVHLGPHVTALERDGIASRLGDINRQAVALGKERAADKRVLRELGDEIGAIELEAPQAAAAKPAEPGSATARKNERPSKAQQLPPLDLSRLDWVSKEPEEWEKAEKEDNRSTPERASAAAPRLQQITRPLFADLTAEIARRSRERDERVRRVLAKAEQRQARRDEALQRLTEKRPVPPRGLLAAFKEKAHQKAVAAWDHARVAAGRLAKEAKQLVQRLREVAQPERVREWAQVLVRRVWSQVEQTRDSVPKTERAVGRDEQRPAPGPAVSRQAQQGSEQLRALQQALVRAKSLGEKAKSQPLALLEKRELARAWDGVAELMASGNHGTPPELRQLADKARLHAHRAVAASVFLTLPRAEAVKQNPKLAGAYALLDILEQKAKADGLSVAQREQVIERARQRVATAIEQGQSIQVKPREQAEPARQRDRGRDIER